ncbi:hypothetical protein ABLE92_10845 [Gordonia sp. VNQ95]|uniref:hypothetical protein n=1 Tax=Gordonia TaxID=2053 RepID=UPI0032B4D1B1
MVRDHTGAPRSLPVYLALMWLPVLADLVFGETSPTLFASVVAAVVLAGGALSPQTRRLMAVVLAALRVRLQRIPAPLDANQPRRRRGTTIPRELILVLRVGDPRAPTLAA